MLTSFAYANRKINKKSLCNPFNLIQVYTEFDATRDCLYRGLDLGFFVFGTSILRQGVSVLIRVRDLEGLGVLADDMEAISVRLSLIRGRRARGARSAGVRGARGVEGRRFRGIFSFNISYLGRES